MDKHIRLSHNEIPLGSKGRGTIDYMNNMAASEMQLAKWKKPDTTATHWFCLYNILAKMKVEGGKRVECLEVRRKAECKEGIWGLTQLPCMGWGWSNLTQL